MNLVYDHLYDIHIQVLSILLVGRHAPELHHVSWSPNTLLKEAKGKGVLSNGLLPLTGPVSLTESNVLARVSVALSRFEECVKCAQLPCWAINANGWRL